MIEKKDINKLDDEKLVKNYQTSKDLEIVGILYMRYSHLIYGLCLKYLKDPEIAKDASIDIFQVLVKKLKAHEVKFFKSWLYMLSKNHCLMILRKEKRMPTNNNVSIEDVSDDSPFNLELQLLKEQKLNALESAINQLKDVQGTCIKLFYLEEKSYDEIAIEIKEKPKAVKSYIQNGRRNLKLILQNHVFEQ